LSRLCCKFKLILVLGSVYIAGRVLRRLLQQYPDKVQGQQAISEQKARIIYGALEAHPAMYQVIPNKAVRSRMNICFNIQGGNAAAEEAFLKDAAALGLTGLKGHRELKGVRASNYNSIPVEGAEKLASFIGAFASRWGTSAAE
jgi:phosphoserine aminotransferase